MNPSSDPTICYDQYGRAYKVTDQEGLYNIHDSYINEYTKELEWHILKRGIKIYDNTGKRLTTTPEQRCLAQEYTTAINILVYSQRKHKLQRRTR